MSSPIKKIITSLAVLLLGGLPAAAWVDTISKDSPSYLFCWDIPNEELPSAGSIEFSIEYSPDQSVSYDWTYSPKEVHTTVSVGVLAHQAIDLSWAKAESMGGFFRESKRIKRTAPLESSNVLDLFWLQSHGDAGFFINTLDLDTQVAEGKEQAIADLKDKQAHSRILIKDWNLHFKRWRVQGDQGRVLMSDGFCELR